MNIRDVIVEGRRRRIAASGHEFGHPVPELRKGPIVPFGKKPFLVCEIKRRSPSRGAIDESLDLRIQAERYLRRGAAALSVLTEEDHFHGSLRDLMEVKTAFPEACVLRKDFLVDGEDVRVSHRAGADAVLLIASILGTEELAALYATARGLGMEALVEVHSVEDVEKVRAFRPRFVGVNSRNLENFSVDLLHPARIKGLVDWDASVVFESGITGGEEAMFAGSLGFGGLLVGEAVVRDSGKVPEILAGFEAGLASPSDFWARVARGGKHGRPLVKICGLTNAEDAALAEGLGADLLGFVFADSPRKADSSFVRGLPETRALKVGVVVMGEGERSLPPEVEALLSGGFLDAVQLHGEETPEVCRSLGVPYYKALRPASAAAAESAIAAYHCPRVLVDARSAGAYGGTGLRVPDDIVRAASAAGSLWLAGGLGPDNVREAVATLRPELVDASSRLEERPGRKSRGLMERFFREIDHAIER